MLIPPAIDRIAPADNTKSSDSGYSERSWRAQLDIEFDVRRHRTTLVHNLHSGPICVQRPFYPEAQSKKQSVQLGECCHIYVLHPPGGLVAGDRLGLDARLAKDSHVLMTTPSAGKIYGSDKAGHRQQQTIRANIQSGACLEWLPQENIIFSGAHVNLHTHLRLQGDAKFIAWDIICLGRRASQEAFLKGYCEQLIEIESDGELLLRERGIWRGASPMLKSVWGMAGNVVAGTFYASIDLERRQLEQWRQQFDQMGIPGEWGFSQKPRVLLGRYLGQSAQQCRRGFETLYRLIRPLVTGSEVCLPRIWNT